MPQVGFDPPIARLQYYTEWNIDALVIQATMAGSVLAFTLISTLQSVTCCNLYRQSSVKIVLLRDF